MLVRQVLTLLSGLPGSVCVLTGELKPLTTRVITGGAVLIPAILLSP